MIKHLSQLPVDLMIAVLIMIGTPTAAVTIRKVSEYQPTKTSVLGWIITANILVAIQFSIGFHSYRIPVGELSLQSGILSAIALGACIAALFEGVWIAVCR